MRANGFSVGEYRGVDAVSVTFDDGYQVVFHAYGIGPYKRHDIGHVTLRVHSGEVARYNVHETIGGGNNRMIRGSAQNLGKHWRVAYDYLELRWYNRDRTGQNNELQRAWDLVTGSRSTAGSLE